MGVSERMTESLATDRDADAPDRSPLDVVVLGGGGHVGLPLSLVLADGGLRVGIYDTSEPTLARIARGEMPFMEHGAEDLLLRVLATGRLELSASADMIERADTVIIVVGTPVDEFLGPSTRVFERTVDQLAPHLRDGSLVVLRSTVYPGTTEYVAHAFEERGRRVDVAFCPERIAEGHALEELGALPQIIGADTQAAGDRAEALFRRMTSGMVRTSSREAELAKLFTNTWRYMKFAVANQFFAIADQAGVDYTNVLRAIREDYPRASDLPGPGFAAGPCLFKDTMQLAAFTSDHFPIGQAAVQINEGMPAYIVSKLERRHGSLRGRTALSFKLRKLLEWAGATVLCTDPFVTHARFMPLDEVLLRSEILVIGAPHRAYRSLALAGREVVDIWNATGDGIRL
jgi:UDP-N-acetyl-D-mannosaminuronic acid dehydrogenase